MTRPALLLSLMLICSTSFGQTDWVTRFLSRYSVENFRQSSGPAGIAPAGPAAAAGSSISLTTEDMIQLLLEHNRDLTVSRTAPVSSFYSITSVTRPFQPNFHIIGTLNHTTSPSSNVLAGAASLVQLSHDYRVGLDHALQTGTTYTVDFDVARNSSNSVFTVYNPAYNGSIKYTITQHLLRDFGRAVNSHEIRIAKNNEKISELDFELQIIELVTQALNSYWDLVFSAEDVKVKQRALDLAAKTLQDNEIQVQIGTLAPVDLIQAETEVAARNEDLLTGQYTVDQLQDDMKKLISADLDPGLALTRLNLIEPVPNPGRETLLPLSQAIQFALENRREMKQASLDIDNQEINVQYSKNQMLPVLDFTGSYAHLGLGGTQTIRSSLSQGAEVLRVVPGGVGDMFERLFAFTYPGYNVGFNFQIPIRDRAGRADYDRAVNERNLSAMKKTALAQRIALEVRNAYTQLDMSRARVNTAQKTRELTARKLEAEQTKFGLGTSTVRFVLEEQRNLAQAETNEIQALVNYTKALVAYDHAIGNTLARNGIVIDTGLPNRPTCNNCRPGL